MVVILRIQQRLKPYLEATNEKIELDEETDNQLHSQSVSNNQLEYHEIMTGSFTIYCTIIFEDHDKNQTAIQSVTFVAGK